MLVTRSDARESRSLMCVNSFENPAVKVGYNMTQNYFTTPGKALVPFWPDSQWQGPNLSREQAEEGFPFVTADELLLDARRTPSWVCLCRVSNTSFSSGQSWRPSLLKWTAAAFAHLENRVLARIAERTSIAVTSRTGQFGHFRVVTPIRAIFRVTSTNSTNKGHRDSLTEDRLRV